MGKLNKSKFSSKFLLGFISAATLVSSISIGTALHKGNAENKNEITTVDKITNSIKYSVDENSFNRNIVLDARDSEVNSNTELSLIIQLEDSALIDTYKKAGFDSVSEYAKSRAGKAKANINLNAQKDLIKNLAKNKLITDATSNYSIIMNAITVTAKYKDLKTIENFDGVKSVIISTNYEKPKAVAGDSNAVFNDANVYETGIYDSSSVEYTGKGTVVSVLDTGCDYTHSAFQNMPANPRLSKEDVNAVLEHSIAYSIDNTIDVNDVYYSEKIPFGFDYADSDPNIYPLTEDHGTHVAGIIAGQDDVITGVAVDAQLVIMKVFPDSTSGASTEGILQALEDSVLLGVDVINMSLGSTIGFTREADNEYLNSVYEKIEDAGIVLDVAAGNEFSGGYGGESSNTNFAHNPDSGVIGSPSTYKPSMAVASINGILEPYIEANDGETVAFLTQAAHLNGDEYNFVEMLGLTEEGISEKEYEYVTVPGYGLKVNYAAIDVKGKIALVKRGNNTFAEKIAFAAEAGAAGVIIYNNVTGVIKMSVGENVKIAVASISRAAGDEMAKHSTGKIKVGVNQKAGPFMSDFSSWGPTPSLELKPEITAHGGNITSAVIGGGYDVLSGTSMATPNLAGVSALMIEHYNKTNPEFKGEDRLALINQIQMSTAKLVLNENGDPYSPRKQGAGLANLYSAINTKAYLSVDGINKTKIELYDDPEKLGVYEFDFNLVNLSNDTLEYKVVPYTFTESMSSDEETIAEMSYMLNPKMEVTVEGSGTYDSDTREVNVTGKGNVKLHVKLTLSDADKEYLDKTFENGMYVEGFIELESLEENENDQDNIDLSIPFLGFYGSWAQAPIFDKDFYEVESTKYDQSINEDDKIKADYYATTYYGQYYDYYVIPLGQYIYQVDSSKYEQIPATSDKAVISNNSEGISGLADAYLGMLRSAKTIDVKIVDVSTGEVVYELSQNNQKKAFYNTGNGGVTPSFVDLKFDPAELGLANNTHYRLTIDATLDYETTEGNRKSSISTEFFIDNEAPTISDTRFYKEWDKTEKEYRSYVEIDVYDNRFAQSIRLGTIENNSFNSLTYYPIPIYQENPSEITTVKIEITEYLPKILATEYSDQLVVAIDDYALNTNLFLINMGETGNPEFTFENGETSIDVTISPNQVFDIESLTKEKFGTFIEGLVWESSNENIAIANDGKILGVREGNAVITGKNLYQIQYEDTKKNYDLEQALKLTLNVKVLGEIDAGYVEYDKPLIEKIGIKSFTTIKAFTDDYENTDLVENDHFSYFGQSKALSVYPSESFKLDYSVEPWTIASDRYTINWKSSNNKVATVDENGVVTAMGKGSANITLSINIDGRDYTQTDTLRLTVKDPFVVQGSVLMAYKGWGGEVVIPDDLGLMFIYPYAFSLYTYGAITDYEIIYNPVGNDTITKIVIPEGIEQVMEGAFSNLTALEEVVLPRSLRTLEKYTFRNNPNLTKVNLNYVEKIGDFAFENCPKLTLNDTTDLSRTATIGISAFKNCTSLTSLDLSNIGYAGRNALEGTTNLNNVALSDLTYISRGMFKNSGVKHITLNSDVIPEGAFEGAESLESVTFTSSDVIISEKAFSGAKNLTTVTFANEANVIIKDLAFANTDALKGFTLPNGNISLEGNVFLNSSLEKLTLSSSTKLSAVSNSPFVNANSFKEISLDGESQFYNTVDGLLFDKNNSLLLVPTQNVENIVLPKETASISNSAFAGNKTVKTITFEEGSVLTSIEDNAFNGSVLESITLPNNEITIGVYAFHNARKLETVNGLSNAVSIGKYAFANTAISTISVGNNVVIGDYAFYKTNNVTSITLPEGAVVGKYAFADSVATSITFSGANIVLDDYAFTNNDSITSIDLTNVKSVGEGIFAGCGRLENATLGSNITKLTDSLFFECIALKSIDLTGVTSIGTSTFEGCLVLKTVSNTNTLSTIGTRAFVNTFALKSIDLSNVKEMNELAFANSGVVTVSLDLIEKLGNDVFSGAQSLTTVVLNENLTELAQGAFYNCISLKTINTENLVTIKAMAFAGCSGLTKVTLTNAITLEEYAFYASGLARATLPATTTIAEGVFYGSKVTLVSMPVVESIGYMAFSATSLTGKVELPTTLTNIGAYAFADNTKIKAFVFKDNGKQVDTGAVNDYILLDQGVLYTKIANGYQLVSYPEAKEATSYEIIEGTTKIAAYAVSFQQYLTKVTLPYTLQYIGDFAFADCEKLTTFTFNSYYAPTLEGLFNPDYEYETDYYDQNGNKTQVEAEAVEVKLSEKMQAMYKYALYFDIYYYSNFVGYVGQVDGLTIEYPKNGHGYNGVIYNWFFDNKVITDAVMSDVTLAAFNAIAALKDASEITLDDEAAVVDARVLFSYIDADDAEQIALITNYDRLVQAEAKIKELKPVVMDSTTKKVFDMIENLKNPADLVWSDRYDVEDARAFYNLITDPDQLAFITNLDKLVACEEKIEELRAIQTLPSNVLAVYNAINALPTEVTLEDEAAIVAARTAFDALTEEEQAKLSDKVVAKLVAAEEALASLKTPSKSSDGNQTGLIIGISVAAVVVIAGVVVFVLKKKKSK